MVASLPFNSNMSHYVPIGNCVLTLWVTPQKKSSAISIRVNGVLRVLKTR